ncbi:MAG: tryptophan-rich sensory protein [Anaerolineaceae bacterium]|nr:tryptophan-rich sensory protein [Anaerolineaceae bacterium]
MRSLNALKIANVVAYILTLFMNFLSQTASRLGLDIFQYTVAELGESRAIFFLPAGYVFAIWGVIYLGLAAFLVYQYRGQHGDEVVEKIGWWFVLSCVGNITWLYLFLNDQIAISTIAILLILISLIAIYLRLGIGRAVSRALKWAVHIPFSIYLGWVSVATVANIAAALYAAGNEMMLFGIAADVWTVIMMAIAAVLGLLMLYLRGDIAYALVIVWALVGIYVRPFDTPLFADLAANMNPDLVNIGAVVAAVVIVAAIAIYWLTIASRSQQRQSAS